MPDSLTLLMAQLNPTVGDINANTQKIIDVIEKNQKKHDIIVFPECVLTGYPPEDLLFRTELFQQIETALQDITAITKQCHIILGHPSQHQNVLDQNSKLCEAVAFEEILHQYPNASYVKLDIEGPEYAIIERLQNINKFSYVFRFNLKFT